MTLDSHGKLALVQVIVYIPIGLFCIYNNIRHGFRRDAGWIYLTIFTIIKIAGSIMTMEIENGKDQNLTTTAAIMNTVALSPLLNASLSFLNVGLNKSRSFTRHIAAALKPLHLLIIVGLFLSVSGGVSRTKTSQNSLDDGARELQAASGVFALAWILAYLVRNQRCFLEEDTWKVVPWANDPTSKTTTDCLLDIFCHLPGVVEDMKALKASTGATEELSVSYVILGLQIKALLGKLIGWRITWEEDYSNTYFNVGWDILKQLGVAYLDSYPFPTAIFFSEPVRVTELCMYNALLVLLQQLWKQLPDYIGLTYPFDEGNSSWPQPSIFLAPGNGSTEEVVGEICKLVYYQFLSHPGKSGALQIMFPLQVAQRTISSKSLEAQWLCKVIYYIADDYGFNVVRYSEECREDRIII
ncbi:hypothetical protein TrVFT333_006472 [Trichoderma virens FT-333]|nr:hypothetical protein TrVFT333_006472 [Trichoderma virens FT-333]